MKRNNREKTEKQQRNNRGRREIAPPFCAFRTCDAPFTHPPHHTLIPARCTTQGLAPNSFTASLVVSGPRLRVICTGAPTRSHCLPPCSVSIAGAG